MTIENNLLSSGHFNKRTYVIGRFDTRWVCLNAFTPLLLFFIGF